MSIQGTDGLDRPRLRRRGGLAPSPFTARAAGLYSEVVWDRSWAAPTPGKRPAAGDADREVSPTE